MMNKIKTLILLSILSGLLMFLGLAFGGESGLIVTLIMAISMNLIAYFYSDKIVLKMYNAKELDKNKYNNIHVIVEELAHNMKIPMPKLWIIETNMANAFATGRNPKNASVAVTTGILQLLDERELTGVLAHELSHVKNRDILVTTIAATIATAIGYMAHTMQYAAIFGSRNNRRNGNAASMIFAAILMPIAATLLQLSISRSREYLADETGAECCKDPLALASALEKLHLGIKDENLNENNDTVHASTASLFIINPFTSIDWMSLFSTHPPMNKRIERLHNMSKKKYFK